MLWLHWICLLISYQTAQFHLAVVHMLLTLNDCSLQDTKIWLDPILMQMRNSCNLVVVSNLPSFVVRCCKESLKSVGNANLLTQLQFENSNFLCGCSKLPLVLMHRLVLQQCACLWLQKIFILGVPSFAETSKQ